MGSQKWNVLAALAKRRQAHRKDHEPVVKILAKGAALNLCCQVAVCSAHDAHVDLPLAGVADGANRSFLQRAQKLGLQRHGHLAHFIQKEGAFIGDFEKPFLIAISAGECALAMTE